MADAQGTSGEKEKEGSGDEEILSEKSDGEARQSQEVPVPTENPAENPTENPAENPTVLLEEDELLAATIAESTVVAKSLAEAEATAVAKVDCLLERLNSYEKRLMEKEAAKRERRDKRKQQREENEREAAELQKGKCRKHWKGGRRNG